MSDLLRLKAADSEDLQIVSAILQDALVPVCDVAYDPSTKQFAMAVSRFRWEKAEEAARKPQPVYEWINSLIRIDGVHEVKCMNFDLGAKGKIHELLALLLEQQYLTLVFAGGSQLRLTLDRWRLRLEDVGAPWPTAQCPCHDRSAEAS